MGARCSQLAIAWWTLEQANSVALLSIMSGGAMAAEVLAKPLLGWMGDRYSKLRLIQVGNGVAFLAGMITLALAVSGHFQVTILFGAVILTGAVVGVRDPLQSNMIPELLAPEKVASGFRMMAMLSSFSLILGPGVAGLLLSLYSIPITLAIDASLILAALLLIPAARFDRPTATSPKTTATADRPLALLTSGFKMVFHVRMERYLSLFAMAMNVMLYPFFTIAVPLYVKDVMLMQAWYVGFLDVFFGVGILLGSRRLLPCLARSSMSRDHAIMAGYGLLGLNLVAIGLSADVLILPCFFFCGGVGLIWINMNTSRVRCLATPERFRNRMVATISFLSQAASPIGALTAGLLLGRFGVSVSTKSYRKPMQTSIRPRFLRKRSKIPQTLSAGSADPRKSQALSAVLLRARFSKRCGAMQLISPTK
jgi:DHA3 family macrolide efflux protein-like MFS transporter